VNQNFKNTANVSREKCPRIESISKEKMDYSYVCSKIPFSGNLEVNDLVHLRDVERLEDLPKHIPNGITIWHFIERILSSPQANHTKDALYATRGWGKERKHNSFRTVESEFV
jgi:hypothetical protein